MEQSRPKAAARAIEQTRWFRVLARCGYAANGLVHILIGIVVVVIAFGGRGESDQAGAFRAIVQAPLGVLALWIVASALAALGVWHFLDGLLVRATTEGGFLRKWGRRISEWGQAIVFLALGVFAAAVALGARPNGDESAQEASRGLIQIPGGVFVLALVGLGVAIGGVSFIVMGILRSFRKRMRIPENGGGRIVTVLGSIGFVAKGIALAVVAILLLVAAVRDEPEAAGGLDGAIDALLQVAAGPFLVGLVGAGFLAYGVFCFFRARFAKF